MGKLRANSELCDAEGRPFSSRLIDVAGHETYMVEAGDGPPLLLLHGFGDSVSSWRRVAPALSRTHRVLAVDLPGFGRSEPPRKAELIEHYPIFFEALADRLEISRTSVVGHSLGGAIALKIALEQPRDIDRIALIAPAGLGDAAPWWWHAVAGTYVNWQAMLKLPNPLAKSVIRGALRSFLRQTLVHDVRQLEHLIEEFVERHGGRTQLAKLVDTGKSLIGGYDGQLLEQARKQLSMPVTVIWGRQDRLADPGHARDFSRAVPHSKVVVLESCGHYPQMEFPTQVGSLLADFLSEPRRVPARRRRTIGHSRRVASKR